MRLTSTTWKTLSNRPIPLRIAILTGIVLLVLGPSFGRAAAGLERWGARSRSTGSCIERRATPPLAEFSRCAAFSVLSGPATPDSKSKSPKRETREIRGVVLQVGNTSITIQSKTGEGVTLTTFEDYTDRVTTGAEVTAMYYPQDNGPGVLKSLDAPPELLFVPVGEIQNRVHRLVLLPHSDVPDPDGLYDAIRDYLHTNFTWYVAPQYLTAEVSRKSQAAGSMLDATDPKTGNFDLTRYLTKSQGLIPKLAEGTRSDAVLQVDVVQVQAPVSRLVASWDGVEEGVSGSGMRTLAKFSVLSHRGDVSASSVELKLWDAKGKLMWRNRRGLALLQVFQGASNRLRDRPLSEFLMNTPGVQEWLAAAFKSVGPLTYDSSTSKAAKP